MWEPRPLTTLWAFTVYYRDSFTFARESAWSSAPGTISAHKNRISAHFSSLVNTENRAAIFTLLRGQYNWPIKIESISQSCRESVLLAACKVKNAATRTRIKINHCKDFLTLLHKLPPGRKLLEEKRERRYV
jgi:hypothetical protein